MCASLFIALIINVFFSPVYTSGCRFSWDLVSVEVKTLVDILWHYYSRGTIGKGLLNNVYLPAQSFHPPREFNSAEPVGGMENTCSQSLRQA